MLLLTCPCCKITVEETVFATGCAAHPRQAGQGRSDAELGLARFRAKRFVDESVSAGVAH